jgi:hypothetical protein
MLGVVTPATSCDLTICREWNHVAPYFTPIVSAFPSDRCLWRLQPSEYWRSQAVRPDDHLTQPIDLKHERIVPGVAKIQNGTVRGGQPPLQTQGLCCFQLAGKCMWAMSTVG